MKAENVEHQIGRATYEIQRVFTGEKTPQQVVMEEIITTAKGRIIFDRSGKPMV